MQWTDKGEVVSYKRIREYFERMINSSSAMMIHRLVTGDYNPEHYKSVKLMIAEAHCHRDDIPPHDKVMTALNEEMGFNFHGVECVRDGEGAPLFEYINSGRTYSPSIVYDLAAGTYHLSSWGDYLEAVEDRLWASLGQEWEGMSIAERIEFCQEAGISIFSARSGMLPGGIWAYRVPGR